MSKDIILQISNRIKEKRKEQKITLQELAVEAGVTKGLISQIENSRTIPSLPVLLNIIRSLHVDLNDFFEKIDLLDKDMPVVIKASQYESIEKEYVEGIEYNRIISFNHDGKLVDVILYRQSKNARKGYVSTNAFEFNYMISGSMYYIIDGKKYQLKAGDSFYYDARKTHTSKCTSATPYEMLVVYFFDEK